MTASATNQDIYELIRDRKYKQAIKALLPHSVTNSKEANSLLAYCYYHSSEFLKAAQIFEGLGKDYRLYEAQAYFKAGNFDKSQEALSTVEESSEESVKLQRALAFESHDPPAASSQLQSDASELVFQACLLFRNEKFAAAKQTFSEAVGFLGRKTFLLYNLAVCEYYLRDWKAAISLVEEILAIQIHQAQGDQISVMEVLNLKSAILFILRDYDSLHNMLSQFPERDEADLDAVSLHNLAIFKYVLAGRGLTGRLDAESGTESKDETHEVLTKLEFLLKGGEVGGTLNETAGAHAPAPTLRNLLVLLIDHEGYDSAADTLADFAGLVGQNDFDFFEALILAETAPDEGVRRLEQLTSDLKSKIDASIKSLHQSKVATDLKQNHEAYNDILDLYLRTTLALGRVFFKLEKYVESERVLASVADYFSENIAWRTNVGHVLFAQEKFKDAVKFYELALITIRDEHDGDVLQVQAVVVANLCVSYVMISENEKAEALIREVESQEDLVKHESEARVLHSTVINLVIGTLYCVKSNWEFGLSRVLKAVDPIDERLTIEVWEYVKRSIASFLQVHAKGCLLVRDSLWNEISTFLEQIVSRTPEQKPNASLSICNDARILKLACLKLRS